MNKPLTIIPEESIERRICVVRSQKVMFDFELADLYGVETRTLIQAVKRNAGRFPADFMFQLSQQELDDWRSQIVTSNPAAKMSLRRRPYAFTEHGILMLSSVLRSERAVQVNIAIMRTFVHMREAMTSHKELSRRIDEIETKYDTRFKAVFDAIRKLMEAPPVPPKKPIGFIYHE